MNNIVYVVYNSNEKQHKTFSDLIDALTCFDDVLSNCGLKVSDCNRYDTDVEYYIAYESDFTICVKRVRIN